VEEPASPHQRAPHAEFESSARNTERLMESVVKVGVLTHVRWLTFCALECDVVPDTSMQPACCGMLRIHLDDVTHLLWLSFRAVECDVDPGTSMHAACCGTLRTHVGCRDASALAKFSCFRL
jgi:hypothetical protein